MAVNQVRFNGDDLINLRQDSVDEDKLTKGDTAHKKSGVGIEGKADYYAVKDEVADISDEDYIPFYDVSEKKKRKNLFSSFISKIKDIFVARQPDDKGYTIRNVADALEIKHHNVIASKTNNNVSSVIYPSMESHLDKDGRIFMRTESIVEPNGRIGWYAYVRNYDEQGNRLGQKGIKFLMDKQGKLEYVIDDMDAFREAIHTLDNKGTAIPDNADLDDYITAGSYYVADNGKAATISNMPMGKAWSGKLWVLDTDSSTRVVQMYITNKQDGNKVYFFARAIDDNGTAQPWTEFTTNDSIPYGGYAVATISGSTVTANIDNFSLKNGAMVMIRVENALPVNATLNINNTGAKSIWYYHNSPVRYGDNVRLLGGVHYVTLMYDSINDAYHIVSFDITPILEPQNYVANTSGYIVNSSFFDSNGFQLKHNVATGALMYNYFKNGTWRGDKRLIEQDQSLVHYGQEIPDNADLNNYKTEGVYNIALNNRANTILNIPTKLAGKLTVMRIAGSSYASQIYITYAADNMTDGYTTSQSYNIFYRTYDNYNDANRWTGWRQLTLDRDLSALMTATGKNLLPSWSYSASSYASNGITFTFNPATGEVTANGTATADSHCALAGATINPYDLPAGEYILSGCPSGGSSSTYMLDLQLKFSYKDGEKAFYDFGEGIKIKLDDYAGSYTTQNYFIRIVNGTTVNNKVFKPMLRPAFSNDTYKPNDSFYKGNMYIGYCETAGNAKDKVASVDGYFKLRKGVTVCVKFKNSNSYNATSENKVTLNVNGTGAYNIYYNNGNPTGTNRTAFGYENRYITYVFDGGSWVWQSHGSDDNTTYSPQSLGFGYGTCSTPNSTSEKAVSLSGYNLVTNGFVSVRFTNAVSANATMNINTRGAKPIYYNNSAIGNNMILAGCTALFVYDGTRYHLLSTDYASISQMYYIQRNQVVWSSVIGNNYNTTSWSCNIQRQGRIIIGGLEIATSQGANTITFPSYNQNNDKVLVHFPSIPLAGYYECIVTVGATTYPAFISVNSAMGTTITLRTNLTITNNSNIKVTFFAFLQ